MSVKAASVIGHCYLQSRCRTRKLNPDRLGPRMPCYVGQGLLKNAIQTDLDRGRQVVAVPVAQMEIHSYMVGLCILGNVSAQRNTQTMVVEHCGVESAGQPADFV